MLRQRVLTALIALAALLFPSPRRAAGYALALVVLALPGALALRTASTLDDASTLIIERQAPLGRSSLALLRRLTDRGTTAILSSERYSDQEDRR